MQVISLQTISRMKLHLPAPGKGYGTDSFNVSTVGATVDRCFRCAQESRPKGCGPHYLLSPSTGSPALRGRTLSLSAFLRVSRAPPKKNLFRSISRCLQTSARNNDVWFHRLTGSSELFLDSQSGYSLNKKIFIQGHEEKIHGSRTSTLRNQFTAHHALDS